MPDPEIDLLVDTGVTTKPAMPRPTASPVDRRRDEVRRKVLRLYDAHHRELATFVRAIERDRDTADDVVSETFARLVDEVRRRGEPDQPRAWLHRVAANLVIDGGRRRVVFGRIAGRLVDRGEAPPPDEAVLGWEFRRELREALGGLSVEARTALMLAAHGFSGREIATTLGRTELATRSLMWRARTELRDRLTGWEARP
jgi:RNA polymerase sigma-70 factor (ECF subfamily)